MSLKVRMSRDQMQSGRVLPNGEYLGLITDVGEDQDKNGSTYIVLTIKVQGHPEYEGVPVRVSLCPDWFGGGDLIRRFYEAVSGKKYAEGTVIDFEKTKNMKVRFFNKQGEYKGKPTNDVQDFSPAETAVAQ